MFRAHAQPEFASRRAGVAFGAGAYLIWGLSPLYFQLLRSIAPLEILAHRVVWSVGLLAFFLSLQGRWDEIRSAWRHRPTAITLAATAVLLSVNWYTFIYCTAHGYLLQSSMGYFIAPLMSMTLAILILRERLRGLQLLSLGLVCGAIAHLVARSDAWPTLALILALSGSCYALLRKWNQVAPLIGGIIETLILLPLAAPYVIIELYRAIASRHDFVPGAYALLPITSLVTGLPLLLFAIAARRLRLTTIGFLQYITPSCHLFLAVVQGHETVSPVQWATFALIWLSLVVYTADSLRSRRGQSPTQHPPPPVDGG